MPKREWLAALAAVIALAVVLPACNTLPAGSPLHVSNFTLNLFGKFLTYAILALGLDLLWGYAGVLSLGHGVFFGLGAYAMGMHLMLEIGTKSVYQTALPDFMVWNRVTALPLFWRPFWPAWRARSMPPRSASSPRPRSACCRRSRWWCGWRPAAAGRWSAPCSAPSA